MKPSNGRTVVRQEKRVNDTVQVGGRVFLLDPVFRQYWNTVHMAEVVATDRLDIAVGDIVIVHHFVNAPEQRIPIAGNFSYLEYNQIYAKLKGEEIVVLNEYVLVEPVTYGEAGLIKESKGLLTSTHSAQDHVEKIGIAAHIGRQARHDGLKPGDKILFNKNCEYEMLIKGKLYYRMEFRDVITTIDEFSDLVI